jgi:serine palmitoyltransferase
LLAVSASEGINILQDTPSILATLQENIRAAWSVLGRVDCITIPSHQVSPIIHIYVRNPSPNSLTPDTAVEMNHKPSNPHSIHTSSSAHPGWDLETEENLLQEVVDECISQGVLVTKSKRLRGQEMVEARPSIRLALTAALNKKETEKAASVVKAALIKVLTKRR